MVCIERERERKRRKQRKVGRGQRFKSPYHNYYSEVELSIIKGRDIEGRKWGSIEKRDNRYVLNCLALLFFYFKNTM